MPKIKYFAAINTAQLKATQSYNGKIEAFDLNELATQGMAAKIKATLFQKLIGPVYAVSRAYFPVMNAAGFYHVTRDAQVRQILTQPDIFTVQPIAAAGSGYNARAASAIGIGAKPASRFWRQAH